MLVHFIHQYMNWRVWALSLLRRGNLSSLYKENLSLQCSGTVESVEREMQENAWNIFRFHLRNNGGYRQFLKDKGLDIEHPESIKWEDIPLMTKPDYKQYDMAVKDHVYAYCMSGGSTNIPFKYPLSKESALSLWPNHWVLHQQIGLTPCSRMLMLMSYHSRAKSLSKKFYHWLSNFKTFFSFNLTEENVAQLILYIKKEKIEFIYGYSSSIFLLLRYLRDHDIRLPIKGIISTSENVIPINYELARKYCSCEMYNQYGAHDGDVFAFECEAHDGLHILHNSSTVEIIDREIVLTAVRNYAYPFIRYKVGDVSKGDLIKDKCSCGRTLFRLPGLEGRSNVMIQDSDGKEVAVIMFTMPLDCDYSIEKYQVIENREELIVNIISNTKSIEQYEREHMPYIRALLKRNVRFVLNQPLHQLANFKTPLYIKLN